MYYENKEDGNEYIENVVVFFTHIDFLLHHRLSNVNLKAEGKLGVFL